ncbi:hypothetical protein ACFVVX_37150, partial [Kitasatospora sp. NPDC058170]
MSRGTGEGESRGIQDRFVPNNLDTLATALYVRTGDLLKAPPHLAPWRPTAVTAPQLGPRPAPTPRPGSRGGSRA